jgi:hypothetical protein
MNIIWYIPIDYQNPNFFKMKNNLKHLIRRAILEEIKNKELDEQDAATSGADTEASAVKPDYPTVTKWETGVVRGPANQIALVKWSDIVKVTRGKANTLL